MAKRKRRFGEARHGKRKIERLLFPETISAPWLTRVGPPKLRGRGWKTGVFNFAIYRATDFVDPGFGPGKQIVGKKPYMARVCVGRRHFERKDTKGCDWGRGRTPTKALAAATSNLGRRLAKVKRGR